MSSLIKSTAFFVGLFFVMSFVGNAAEAGAVSVSLTGDMADDIMKLYLDNAANWEEGILTAAKRLFVLLAGICFIWQFVPLILSGKGDLGDLFSPVLRWTILVGIFYWLLNNGAIFAEYVIGGLTELGTTGVGNNECGSPSALVWAGFRMLTNSFRLIQFCIMGLNGSQGIMEGILLAIQGFFICLFYIIAAIIALIVLTLVAVQLMLTIIGAYICAYAGVFVLAFGGATFTRDIAISYFKGLLSVGLNLMTTYLIIGLGIKIFNGVNADMQ